MGCGVLRLFIAFDVMFIDDLSLFALSAAVVCSFYAFVFGGCAHYLGVGLF